MSDVSIIIPALNEEKHLAACLAGISALDYDCRRVETIVVDNGSTDSTRDIASRHGAVVLRDDRMNVSGLRNLGAQHARGELLAFVDADCIVSSDWLKQSERYFDKGDIVAWGSPPVVPEDGTWVQKAWYLVRKKKYPVQVVEWLESMNFFVRKEHFVSLGGFDDTLVTCEDVDFCYRIGKTGKIIADSRLEVKHFGEARTIKTFFRKELWRGQSNFAGLFRHGFSIKELPSIAIPLYYGVFLPINFLGAAGFGRLSWFVLSIMLYLMPVLIVLWRARGKGATIRDLCHLCILAQIYFFARTAAVVLHKKHHNASKRA